MPPSSRKVRVDREGNFQLGGHRYYLTRSQSIINEGQWECWDAEPDDDLETLSEIDRHRRNRPLWVEPSFREARDHIDRAADVGHF